MRTSAFILIALFAALSVVSCGDDDSDPPTSDETDSGEASTDTDTDTDADTDSDTDTGPGLGVCGRQGNAIVGDESFQGTEDYYLTGEEGQGEDVCRVQLEVNYVGVGPNPDQCPNCLWAYTVELTNPVVLIDESDACANSDLGLDETALAGLDGSQVSFGYGPDPSYHFDLLYQYNEAQGEWVGITQSVGWDEETGELTYKTTDLCGY